MFILFTLATTLLTKLPLSSVSLNIKLQDTDSKNSSSLYSNQTTSPEPDALALPSHSVSSFTRKLKVSFEKEIIGIKEGSDVIENGLIIGKVSLLEKDKQTKKTNLTLSLYPTISKEAENLAKVALLTVPLTRKSSKPKPVLELLPTKGSKQTQTIKGFDSIEAYWSSNQA